jgi:ABC-type branched-subunit amino acid transport system permease subunit
MNAVSLYVFTVATIGCIFAIGSLGLNMRYGWTGNLDLSFYMFVALGAYIQGVLTLPKATHPAVTSYVLGLSLPFPVGVLGAMAVCAATSLLLGAIALRRLRSDYFAIVTIVTTLIVYAVIQQFDPLFNGYVGLYNVPQPLIAVLPVQVYPVFLFGVCAACLAATYVVAELLFRSPFGRALRAAREDEVATEAFGRNVYSLKLRAFAISGAVAGLSGALLITWLSAWNPSGWSPIEVLLLYAAVFVGGTGNNRGVVLGAILIFVVVQELSRFLPLPAALQTQSAVLQNIVVAVLIAITIWIRPQGVLPEPRAKFPSQDAPRDQLSADGT